jgi:hypothetical protein
MKVCPNCSHPIALSQILRHINELACSSCGTELAPDRRSQWIAAFGLLAYIAAAAFFFRRLHGEQFASGFLIGLLTGLCGSLVYVLLFTLLVRHHVRQPGESVWT